MSSSRYSELNELATTLGECIAQKNELRELNAELLALAYRFMGHMDSFGDWEDGCFYYNGTAAPELQGPIEAGRALIAKSEKLK